jgi:hypothetical protein
MLYLEAGASLCQPRRVFIPAKGNDQTISDEKKSNCMRDFV